MEDRRKHQRFKLADGCIIDHSRVVGTIADISMGGLSCICLELENCQHEKTPQFVDIYCGRGKLRLEKVRIQVLDSTILLGKFADHFGVRRCRIRFEQLEEAQISQLEKIILTSALSASPPRGAPDIA